MAPRNQKIRKSNKQPQSSRAKRNRRRNGRKSSAVATSKSSRSSGLGSILHKGVRSILSLLPGSSFTTKAADFLFSSLGWSENGRISDGVFAGDVYFNGLFAIFYLTPAMLLGDSIGASTSEVAQSPNNELRMITTNYAASRLVHFRVACRNAGPASVHGQWGLGFWPFTAQNDEDNLSFLTHGVTLGDIRQAPFFVDGPVKQPLTLKHYFTLSNWQARLPGVHSKRLGIIAISYTEQIRSSYSTFTPEDFDPQVEVSGNVLLTTRRSDELTRFSNSIAVPKLPAVVIKTPKAKIILGKEGYRCTHKPGDDFCRVEGVSMFKTPPLTLSDMAID